MLTAAPVILKRRKYGDPYTHLQRQKNVLSALIFRQRLTILQWVSAAVPDIVADIHPKGQEHINNDRRTHRKKRDVNKVLADRGTGYSYFFTNIGANPKHLPFNKVLEPVHTAKL